MTGTDQEIQVLRTQIEKLQYDVQVAARAHALAADRQRRRQVWLGASVVVLSAMAGTIFLTDLAKSYPWMPLFAGALSLTAAILAALQTFFNPRTREQKHFEAATKLKGLSLRLDLLWTLRDSDKIEQVVLVCDDQFEALTLAAPYVSMKLQKEAARIIRDENIIRSSLVAVEKRPRVLSSSPPIASDAPLLDPAPDAAAAVDQKH